MKTPSKRFAAALALAALALAGCSAGPQEGSATASPAAATADLPNSDLRSATVESPAAVDPVAMAAYERCVVDHGGVMPDPDVEEGASHPPITTQQQAAFDACRDLLPEEAHVSGANGKRNTVEFRAFQTCMSREGVTVGGPGSGTSATGAEEEAHDETAEAEHEVPTFGLDLEDRVVAKALKACAAEFAAAQESAELRG